MTDTPNENLITLTADIVAAHVQNNSVSITDMSHLILSVHGALAGLSGAKTEPVAKQEPAVSIRSSVKTDYIVCLEDGKKLKMLKRHLMTTYGMTPEDYRVKWGLAKDYPMVAPSYAAKRKELAMKIGLGRKLAPAGDAVAAKPAPKRVSKRKEAAVVE